MYLWHLTHESLLQAQTSNSICFTSTLTVTQLHPPSYISKLQSPSVVSVLQSSYTVCLPAARVVATTTISNRSSSSFRPVLLVLPASVARALPLWRVVEFCLAGHRLHHYRSPFAGRQRQAADDSVHLEQVKLKLRPNA